MEKKERNVILRKMLDLKKEKIINLNFALKFLKFLN